MHRLARKNPHSKSLPAFLKLICLASALFGANTIASSAQTFTTIVNFGGPTSALPRLVSLVQGTDGNLYGTTSGAARPAASSTPKGTVFKMTPAGAITTIYTFTAPSGTYLNGATPFAGLLLGTDGFLYGTTDEGGTSTACTKGCGTVFKISQGGVLTTLHSFNSLDGSYPIAALVQGTDGNLYGSTNLGGSFTCAAFGGSGCGTIFKITPNGQFTTLHSFNGADGHEPGAALIQGTDGSLYGTTFEGGANDAGTVFRITTQGQLSTLHNFCSQSGCPDGSLPSAALFQADNGEFYGTTWSGGDTQCSAAGYGTVFKITSTGTLTTLYAFCGNDGELPNAPLVRGTDGDLYSTTSQGGGSTNCQSYYNGCGTIFKLAPNGALTTVHAFDSTDGNDIIGGVIQATNGTFYGTTYGGGISKAGGNGTVYSLSTGLGPFVETLPTSSKSGATIEILGTNLTGATAVTFNGLPARFSVNSPTLIKATVPAGATTGPVVVTTPTGPLTSNQNFHITK
jgi:uncharacterized repeat protein (TIGR03803 family)